MRDNYKNRIQYNVGKGVDREKLEHEKEVQKNAIKMCEYQNGLVLHVTVSQLRQFSLSIGEIFASLKSMEVLPGFHLLFLTKTAAENL